MNIMFSSAEELGYDLSVRRVDPPHDPAHFVFSIGGRHFRTQGPPIYDAGATVLISRGVRAWAVVEIDQDGHDINNGKEMALKDLWVYHDLPSERITQQAILKALECLDSKDAAQETGTATGNSEEIPTTRTSRMKEYFLTIAIEEDVRLSDGSKDITLSKPSDAVDSKATPTHDSRRPHNKSSSTLRHEQKVHRRIVYEERCQTFYEHNDLRSSLKVLAQHVDG